jgi:hypothetical protein
MVSHGPWSLATKGLVTEHHEEDAKMSISHLMLILAIEVVRLLQDVLPLLLA